MLLPNQHHCFSVSSGNRRIWILNNDGSKYENIDSAPSNFITIEQSDINYITNCIEYCLKNNEFIFLKKIFYFSKKIQNETNVWPKYQDEYIIMMVKKCNKILGNNKYFVDQIRQIFTTTFGNTIQSNFMSTFSNIVEQYVKIIAIPILQKQRCKITIEKNIQLLKKQSHWQCFLCKNINLITQNICPYCLKNKLFYTLSIKHTNPKNPLFGKTTHQEQSLPAIHCLNPYQAFISNNST